MAVFAVETPPDLSVVSTGMDVALVNVVLMDHAAMVEDVVLQERYVVERTVVLPEEHVATPTPSCCDVGQTCCGTGCRPADLPLCCQGICTNASSSCCNNLYLCSPGETCCEGGCCPQ